MPHRSILLILPLLFTLFAKGQCTADPVYTSAGVGGLWPKLDTFPDALQYDPFVPVVGTNTITAVVPADTLVDLSPYGLIGYYRVPVIGLEIQYDTGLPAGMITECYPTSCYFPASTNGCFLVTGTPTDLGTYFINFFSRLTIEGPTPLGVITMNSTLHDYRLNVVPLNSLPEASSENLRIKAGPSPADFQTNIECNLRKAGAANLQLLSMSGTEVWGHPFQGTPGTHSFSVPTADLAQGLYLAKLAQDGITASVKIAVVH